MHENRPVYDKLSVLMNYMHSALNDQKTGFEKVKAKFDTMDSSLDSLKVAIQEEYERSPFCDEIVTRIAEFL
jgi:hypothetical protein